MDMGKDKKNPFIKYVLYEVDIDKEGVTPLGARKTDNIMNFEIL